MTGDRIWRRTNLPGASGSLPPDDWCLLDDAGQALARIYKTNGGPNAGRWSWFVQVAPDGTPYNGGTGVAETGREAREAVEALVPIGAKLRAPRIRADTALPQRYPKEKAPVGRGS